METNINNILSENVVVDYRGELVFSVLMGTIVIEKYIVGCAKWYAWEIEFMLDEEIHF